MARMTKAQREWRPGQKKKARSARILFASTVLCLEALMMIFFALTVFGLRRDELNPVMILGGGIGLAVLCILTCALLREPLGYWIGWGIQLVMILLGFLAPAMFIIGLLFAVTWWYAVVKGGAMDKETKARAEAQEAWEREHPEDPGPAAA